MLKQLFLTFPLALLEVLRKIWLSPDKPKALKDLTWAERLVLQLAVALAILLVSMTDAL